jgi:hypothetical protein
VKVKMENCHMLITSLLNEGAVIKTCYGLMLFEVVPGKLFWTVFFWNLSVLTYQFCVLNQFYTIKAELKGPKWHFHQDNICFFKLYRGTFCNIRLSHGNFFLGFKYCFIFKNLSSVLLLFIPLVFIDINCDSC